jgi:8-oxo-dGTP pyrophosphatase MutT (NUDIX family)
MSVDLPRDIVLPVEVIDIRLDPEPHPLEISHKAEIAANWEREIASNPRLFNGTVVLVSNMSYEDGRLTGHCHAARYATFLYWRRHRNVPGTGHFYAHAMLVSSDNALVAIRMAPHTVNAGRVYFAAGSFEPGDFRNGVVDIDYNMRREVKEETGLDLAIAERGVLAYVLSTERGTVIFRRYWMPLSANEIVSRVNAFVAAETDPEISGPVVIHSAADQPDDLLPHMPPLIEWHFSQQRH